MELLEEKLVILSNNINILYDIKSEMLDLLNSLDNIFGTSNTYTMKLIDRISILINLINETIDKCENKKMCLEDKYNLTIYENWVHYLDEKTGIVKNILSKIENDNNVDNELY
jgi:hypothetical protein